MIRRIKRIGRKRASDGGERTASRKETFGPSCALKATTAVTAPVGAKRARVSPDDNLEERVFGGDEASVQKILGLPAAVTVTEDDEVDEQLCSERVKEVEKGAVKEEDDDSSDSESPPEEISSKKAPVWKDDNDSERVLISKKRKLQHLRRTFDSKDEAVPAEQYKQRLLQQFSKTVASTVPSWAIRNKPKKLADSDDNGDSDSDENAAETALTRSAGRYLAKSRTLPQFTLAFKRFRDPTFGHRVKKPIACVKFFEKSNVLMCAGDGGNIMLFKLDGEDNRLLQSVSLPKFPISTCCVTADGEKLIVGSFAQENMFTYDLTSGDVVSVPLPKGVRKQRMAIFDLSPDGNYLSLKGKAGEVHLLSARSMEWLCTLKNSADVVNVCFSPVDATLLYVLCENGTVQMWDVESQECMHSFVDQGAVKASAISLSRDAKFLAIGSVTGIVNVYETSACHTASEPRPLKVISNLTTAVTAIRFSHNGELLAVASRHKDNAIRLVHLKSMSVYDNFPEKMSKLRTPTCIDFSPNGGYIAVGNGKGQAVLFRLLHYDNY